ncbi:hypothetical protein BDR26DRAFT_865673 [Obelidium mucronatum]|nr:hypothetical protein BDR26DRAFT_865673 [Obelidium mucronatum]
MDSEVAYNSHQQSHDDYDADEDDKCPATSHFHQTAKLSPVHHRAIPLEVYEIHPSTTADALYSKLLESVTDEMDQETRTMFVHLSTQVTPIAKFKKYAEKSSSPNPFIRDSALQTSPTVTATQVYNIMYAKQDEDEFLPDLNILDQRQQHPTRQRAISTSSTPSRLQPSSPPLLPTPIRQTPRRRPSLNTSLSEATTHLTQLLQKLSTQQETPTMETLMTNISNLQKSQKTLKETPLPFSKKKRMNGKSKKQDLLANMPPLTPSQQSVQRLHESVYPLDRLIGFVPVLVERLESLTPIHTRGAMLSDALSGVISNHKGSLQDLEMLEGLAGMIDANLTENSKVCARNWESFDVRIKELERRLNGKNVHVRV